MSERSTILGHIKQLNVATFTLSGVVQTIMFHEVIGESLIAKLTSWVYYNVWYLTVRLDDSVMNWVTAQ